MVSVSTIAFRPRPSSIHSLRAFEADAGVAARLKLAPAGAGWCLQLPDGRLVFEAQGASGRQACLEFAHSAGVLALLG
jgi:hypothetical protein